MGGGEIAAGGQHGLADLHGPLPHRLFLDDDPALPLDGPGDAGAHGERRVRRIDDGVDLPVSDVAPLDRDGRLTDPEPHGRFSPRSSAFAAFHARSSSSGATGRPTYRARQAPPP